MNKIKKGEKYSVRYPAFLILLCFSILLNPGMLRATEKCNVNVMDFSGCEELAKNRFFIELILSFPEKELAGTKLGRLARYFYRGVGYFGLFVKETAITNRCEYAEQATENLNRFLREAKEYITTRSDQIVFDWILRANIYSNELSRVKNCVRDPMSAYEIEKMVKRIINQELEQMILDDEKRYETFERVYARLKDVISITSDIINKIESFQIQLSMVDYKINEENGLITIVMEKWSHSVIDDILGEISETLKLQNWLTKIEEEYIEIDITPFIEKWDEMKKRNKAKAEELLLQAEKVQPYLDTYLFENDQYKEIKAQTQEECNELSQQLNAIKTHNRSIKQIYNKIFIRSCTDDNSYWWCK